MKPLTIPAPLAPDKDPGVVDVTPDTWPDPQQVAIAREAIRSGDHLKRECDRTGNAGLPTSRRPREARP